MKILLVVLTIISITCGTSIGQLTSQEFLKQRQTIADQRQAVLDAKHDALIASSTDGMYLWMAIGFGCGIFSLPIAYMVEPSVPATKLIGKSPEYVAFYTETYKQEVKNDQVKNALGGCVLGGIFVLLVYQPDLY